MADDRQLQEMILKKITLKEQILKNRDDINMLESDLETKNQLLKTAKVDNIDLQIEVNVLQEEALEVDRQITLKLKELQKCKKDHQENQKSFNEILKTSIKSGEQCLKQLERDINTKKSINNCKEEQEACRLSGEIEALQIIRQYQEKKIREICHIENVVEKSLPE